MTGWLFVQPLSAARARSAASTEDLVTVRELLDVPAEQIDLARAKLTIDKMVDPTIDVEAALAKIDDIAFAIRSHLPPGATELQKVAAIRRHLHTPGAWNQYLPFRYDRDNPFGTHFQNERLSSYLETRIGNCVSMPILFTVIGRRLGLQMTLSRAPNHVLVKFRTKEGDWLNIEATSGGFFARDVHVQREFGFSDLAVSTGYYMRPLNPREAVVLMLGTLFAHYDRRGWLEEMMQLTRLALERVPSSHVALTWYATANNRMLVRDCAAYGPTLASVPRHERRRCLAMARLDDKHWHKALALGHREPHAREESQYREAMMIGVKE
jgi:regulator of sirC expression with transglutaminase-like and TPR domain